MDKIVCFDIDGVIANGTTEDVYSDKAGWAYEKCTPERKVISILWELHNQGVYIILHTARLSCDKEKTVKWLFDHGVVYDELVMNKPFAHVYVDDKNFPLKFDPDAPLNRIALLKTLESLG
jgi:hypothetical protein